MRFRAVSLAIVQYLSLEGDRDENLGRGGGRRNAIRAARLCGSRGVHDIERMVVGFAEAAQQSRAGRRCLNLAVSVGVVDRQVAGQASQSGLDGGIKRGLRGGDSLSLGVLASNRGRGHGEVEIHIDIAHVADRDLIANGGDKRRSESVLFGRIDERIKCFC